MVSSVRSRPNHYEALGVAPTASGDEIAEAFARAMRSPRPMADAVQIGIAYQTLRNPAKRREYDDSLGLNAKPEQPQGLPHSRQWTAVAQPRWSAPFIAAATPSSAVRGAGGTERPAEPHVAAEPTRQPEVEQRPTTSIGASLRELAKPGTFSRGSSAATKAAPSRGDLKTADDGLEQVVEHILALGREEKERLREGPGAVEWKRPAMALGGFVLGAGLLGAVLGLSVRGNADSAQAEAAVTTPLPSAKPHFAAPAPAPSYKFVEAHPERPLRSAASRIQHSVPRQPPIPWADQVEQSLAEPSPAAGEAVASADVPAAAESVSARAVAADLPLSNRLVARTLDRIGYSCGRVAGTAPAEGEAQGVYKITCSSGQSYQATPVHGRYRFRKLDR